MRSCDRQGWQGLVQTLGALQKQNATVVQQQQPLPDVMGLVDER
jgi:hypothetical protein